MAHVCPFENCQKRVYGSRFACPRCWQSLSVHQKNRVYAAHEECLKHGIVEGERLEVMVAALVGAKSEALDFTRPNAWSLAAVVSSDGSPGVLVCVTAGQTEIRLILDHADATPFAKGILKMLQKAGAK